MSDEARLVAAVDKLDIIDLCKQPHWIYDHETWDELDEVFTELVSMPTRAQADDPSFDLDHYLDSYLVARTDVKAGLIGFKTGLVTQHLVTGHHVTLTGTDTAVCRAHSINIHLPVGAQNDRTLLAHGNDYRFDCVRTDDGWRIRGWVPWVRWSYGDETSHDADAKQRAWLDNVG